MDNIKCADDLYCAAGQLVKAILDFVAVGGISASESFMNYMY